MDSHLESQYEDSVTGEVFSAFDEDEEDDPCDECGAEGGEECYEDCPNY